MKLKHTPGPWEVNEYINNTMTKVSFEMDGKNFELCRITHLSKECNIADARLIAAAPEMLELLINNVKSGKEVLPEYFALDFKDEIKIIEKATGQKIEDILK